jgi:glycosidase
MFEFHVSRYAREKYDFDQSLFRFDGNVIFTNFLAARQFAQKMNDHRDLINFPENAVRAGDINAMGLIDEILHLILSLYRKQVDSQIMAEAYETLEKVFGEKKLDALFQRFVNEFPPLKVYKDEMSPEAYLEGESNGIPNRHIALEELIMLWVTNKNPAVAPFSELFDDTDLSQAAIYRQAMDTLQEFFEDKPYFGPDHQDLITLLRSPAIEEPYSLPGQLEFIRKKWGSLIGDYLYRLLNSMDLIKEEQKIAFAGPGPTVIPEFETLADEENFSPDSDWMPRVVMMAKNAHVWLYQLSEQYERQIHQLDQIPDEELDKLASWGFTGLWLIGLWERSEASKKIKQLCGNPEAVASAYSLRNYSIAEVLGGEEAYERLREKAWQRGIRLASDMVPNHMGIDSDWVIHHPDWFLGLDHSPFPSYTFNGPDLSQDERVGIFIEDHYYDRTDAAVVFKRVDRHTGTARYIYHGNDGTSMPWNDTAQLNYLMDEVREAVVQTILHVARKFPIIRFDAAMTLAKKHYQRLWFPQPGSGGAIPSRAEQGLTKEASDAAFPKEFWREVVDRVAQEVPDTLLLAEAFWLMEGYFVRTLGMHRVYNSAFMNMLRNEENSKYRQVIKNTLEFDPEILKRYVNFMNNPDEKTAVEQFGKGDKYFGICTLMATMPGLPMFGHGQVEGFAEKYGMEYFRPYWDEEPDAYLIRRHQEDIFPILKHRNRFAGVNNFLLYDFYTGEGRVNEDVFAYSNAIHSQHGLVIYHNHYGHTKGWIHTSCSYLNKDKNHLEQRSLYDGLGLKGGRNHYVIFKDYHTNLEFIRSSQEIRERGLYFDLEAYKYHVFMDFSEVEDNAEQQFAQLNSYLNGRGVPSIDGAMQELMLAPILNPLKELLNPSSVRELYKNRLINPEDKLNPDLISIQMEKFRRLLDAIQAHVNGTEDINPILREGRKGLEAILKLNVFSERYPFPGSEKYEATLVYVQNNLGEYPFIWYILLHWNFLRLMGRIITFEPQFAEISRSWLEEWGIVRIIEDTLGKLGMDLGQAHSGVTILKLLILEQNWIDDVHQKKPLRQIEVWFQKEAIRNFININRYHDKLWFNKEAFESLMWWMMTIALIRSIAKPDKSLAESIENLFEGYQIIQTILAAEEQSEFQVGKLLEGLK